MNQDKSDTEIFVYMGLVLLALVAAPVLLVRSWHRLADWLLTHHALVPATDALVTLPGTQAFQMRAAPGARQQTIACLVAPREVYQDLPSTLRWPDFDDIRLRSIGEIQDAFEAAARAPIARAEQIVDVRP